MGARLPPQSLAFLHASIFQLRYLQLRQGWLSIKSRIEPEIERLARQKASFEQKDPEEDKIIEYGFFFLRNLNVLVDFATPEEKLQFLGSILPEKFEPILITRSFKRFSRLARLSLK